MRRPWGKGSGAVIEVGVGFGESWGEATELVWAWGLVCTLTTKTGWLEHLYCAHARGIKGEGERQ